MTTTDHSRPRLGRGVPERWRSRAGVRAQGPLHRPRVPRPGAGAALPAHLAQRLSGRRGGAGRRLRRLRDRRPVDRGGPHRRGAEGLLQRLPAPRHPAGAGPGADRRVPLPVPRLALEPRRVAQVPGGRGQLRPPSGRASSASPSAGWTPGAAGSSSTWIPTPSRSRTTSTRSPTRLEGFKLEDMRIAWYKSVILPANWKTSLDAFIESWHVPGTHPQLLRPDKHKAPPTIAESEQLRRDLQRAVPLPLAPRRPLPLRARGGLHPARGPPTASTPRPSSPTSSTTCASSAPCTSRPTWRRPRSCRTTEGADGPDGQRHLPAAAAEARPGGWRSTTRAVTAAQLKEAMYDWHVFPNTVFLIDMGCCLAYRARPNGNDPDSCIFDVQGLELPPAAGLPTAPPPVLRRLAGGRRWARSSPRTSPTCPR